METMSPHHGSVRNTLIRVAQKDKIGSIAPQESLAFNMSWFMDGKNSPNLMNHPGEFRLRLVGVKYESEKDWHWTDAAKRKQQIGTSIVFVSRV